MVITWILVVFGVNSLAAEMRQCFTSTAVREILTVVRMKNQA